MRRCKLNKLAKTLGIFTTALLVTIVALGVASQPAKAATWLPTQLILEMAQDLRETPVTSPRLLPHSDFDYIDPFHLIPYPQYAYYVLSAENFVLHIDELNDIDDEDIIDLSNASVSVEGESSLEATVTVVVKESTLGPTIGAHELVLGLEESEECGDCLRRDEHCFDADFNAGTGVDFLDASEDFCPNLEAELPTVQIYVFVVDDNTTVEEGLVFYANNFRVNFTERANLSARSVKERARVSAHEVSTGFYLCDNIFLDEEELAEFVQSDRLGPQTLTLSVPATSTPMTAETAIAAGVPIVATSIVVTTNDNRPPAGNDPGENNNNNNNNSGNNNTGNNNNNNTGNNNNSGNNNAGNNNNTNNNNTNNNNNLNTGNTGNVGNNNTGTDNSGGNQSSEVRPPWTSSVRRNPVQISPSEPSETETEVGDEVEDEDVYDDEEDDETQLTIGGGTEEANPPATTEQPRQPVPAPAAEAAGEESTFFRNVMITVGLAIFIAAVIATYLHYQRENLQKKNLPDPPLRAIRPEQHLEPLP